MVAMSLRCGVPSSSARPASALGALAMRAGRALPGRPLSLEGRRGRGDEFRIAVCAPLRGSEGIWGPSCIAAAQLAQEELNRDLGIAGRPGALRVVDSSVQAPAVESALAALADEGEIDAVVGMCISSVRERIVAALGARIPFVYTCLYEGGASAPGLYAIGETAARQLRPSIAWLSDKAHVRRWMLLGNDYVWPRVSHAIARRSIGGCGGQVVAETFLPFGVEDYSEVIELVRRSRADAVLVSMVGQDAVEFNRAFGHAGLARRVRRLSCAVEENQLLAIGAENTEELYVAFGYFESLDTEANLAFKERYRARFGDRAPVLNSIGQSLYEGMHFLAALLDESGPALVRGHASARAPDTPAARRGDAPIYLARAEGHGFRVLTPL